MHGVQRAPTAEGESAALVLAAAENLCGWHEASVAALGFDSRRWPDAWASPDPIPVIFFNWIGLPTPATATASRETPQERIGSFFPDRSRPVALCDPGGALELGPLAFERGSDHPWMVRSPRTVAAARPPAELEIAPVTDADGLREFEAISADGFAVPRVPAFTWHAPAVLADARFHLWIGRAQGRAVSVSMAFVHRGVVGVYGVAAVPDARRRGYGEALTAAALSADPALPSVLQPSDRRVHVPAAGLRALCLVPDLAPAGTAARRRRPS